MDDVDLTQTALSIFMWLLDTATAELHYFTSPKKVPGGYAILSHVWGKHEQSFQEVEAIIKRCKQSGENPRDKVSEKIRRCCEVAEGEGFRWVWNDTCCIDKTSSSELSEAINSMFRYYTLAAVCFVHLDDVEQELDRHKRCCWMKRGWTLQELIAPAIVILLSRLWIPIGSKHSLAETLECVTDIPASLLKHETELADYSVAQRMSWAATRRTTRPEDEAYCLLGIFDIHMPTLYGEGRRAFRRLQEEIMKTRLDTTLFAWGYFAEGYYIQKSPVATFPVLATWPFDFWGCSEVVHCLPDSNTPEASMSFQMSPHGVLARVGLLELEGKTFINLSCTMGDDPILLHVERSTTDGVYSVTSPTPGTRIFVYESDEPLPCEKMTDIYIANHMSYLEGSSSTPERPVTFPCNNNAHAPFHFYIAVDYDITVGHKIPADFSMGTQVSAQNVEEDWKGSPPAVISFDSEVDYQDTPVPVGFLVICGICKAQASTVKSLLGPSSYIHWARVLGPQLETEEQHPVFSDEHDCQTDHIHDWEDHQRIFRGCRSGIDWEDYWMVELSFSKSGMYPNTLILHSANWTSIGKFTAPTPARTRPTFPTLPDSVVMTTSDHTSGPSGVTTSLYSNPVYFPDTELRNHFTSFSASTPYEAVQSTYTSSLPRNIFYGHLSTAMIHYPSIYPNPLESLNRELYSHFTAYSSSTSHTSYEAVQLADSFLLPDHIFYGHLSTAMFRYLDASTPDPADGSYPDERSVSSLEPSMDTGPLATST